MALKLDIEDLDHILGYDPTTHSVAGMPAMSAAKPGTPAMAASRSVGPVDPLAGDIAHSAAQKPVAGIPSMTSAGAPPNVASGTPAPVAIPSLDTSPPQVAKPHEGIWSKLGHGLAHGAEIAGDILAPGVTAMIPGTKLNKEFEEGRAAKVADVKSQTAEREAQGENFKKQNEMVPWTPLGQTEPVMVPFKSIGQLEAANVRGSATEGAAGTRADAARDVAGTKNEAALLKLGYDKNGNPLPDDKLSPQQKQTRDLHQSVIDLNEAREEVERAKNDPNSPQFKLAQERLTQATANASRMAAALGLHQQEFENKVNEQGLVKPSGQSQSRGSAAQAVLDLIPGMEKLVRANAKELGPIMGRLNRGEVAIGNVDPKVAELYAAMKSFYALQPAVHGFRNAEFVKDFESALGTLERDPEAFIAGMKGLKPTLESVAKEGKTFHKRIVEGAPAEIPAAGAGEGAGSFADWKKKQKAP